MKRRDFIQKGAITGVVAAASMKTAKANPVTKAEGHVGFTTQYHDRVDDLYPISPDFRRFDQINSTFNVSFWGAIGKNRHPDDVKGLYGAIQKNIAGTQAYEPNPGAPAGYGRLDYAFKAGAVATESLSGTIFERIFTGDSGPNLRRPDGKLFPLGFYKDRFPNGHRVAKDKYPFSSPKDASFAVKKAAIKYGADLVGIAPYDERWTYNSEVYAPFDASKTGDPPAFFLDKINFRRKVDFGFQPKTVIVLAFEMDYEAYRTSPSPLANGASSIGYSKMYEVSLRLANFIRALGFNTRHAGNSMGVNGPNAVAAGLGEVGRNGMLITEEFGPRVRLARVYTDLELETDKPKSFGVREFCNVCKKCADTCPSKAISFADTPDDPENKPSNRSSNPGVKNKFYLNGQKCLKFWADNDAGCSNCIASCPYNKIDGWHHDTAKLATRIPIVNRITRYLDEAFGYGIVGSVKNMAKFWKRTV
jgi:reductive dehalogenase